MRLWRVRFYGQIEEREWTWGVRSRSNPDRIHDVSIELDTLQAFCTCEDAHYRKNRFKPTLRDPVCWHARQVRAWIRRIDRTLRKKETRSANRQDGGEAEQEK